MYSLFMLNLQSCTQITVNMEFEIKFKIKLNIIPFTLAPSKLKWLGINLKNMYKNSVRKTKKL